MRLLFVCRGASDRLRALYAQGGPGKEKTEMKGMNIIAVVDEAGKKLLMCRRRKNPYQGMLNLVGGKIEPGEGSMEAAYRELNEETGLTQKEIALIHYCDFTYYTFGIRLEVFFGRLSAPAEVSGDENELHWIDLNEDFFDTARFAGEGNIGHIIEELRTEGMVPPKE